MTEFLDALMAEAGITEIITPEKDEELEQEKVIGEADEEMKKLYSLHSKLVNKLETLKKEHKEYHISNFLIPGVGEEPEECKKHHKEIQILEEKLEILGKLFWASVKSKFDCWTEEAVSIKSDWKIVSFKPKRSAGIAILGGPFGPFGKMNF